MKRKFSFSSLRLKLSSATAEDAITPEGLDSPPYSPTPSCMERPVVPPHLIAELRVCCAIVVNETNPPEYDDVPDHREMLKKYIAERDAQKAQAEEAATKEERRASTRPQRKRDSTTDATDSTPYRHVPQNAASNFEATTSVREPSFSYLDIPTFEPLEPCRTKASSKKPQERNEALETIRTTMDARPKTSAAACIDYSGPSVQSSNSTSRSTTTYNEFNRPSTGQTSLAITPGDDKRCSFTAGRTSEPDPESSSIADATAKVWMAQELARRRAEYQSTGQAARPASRATMQTPGSRAGSIAGSVLEGVRDYIKPRASMDSVRSEYNLSRTQSRSGSIRSDKSNTWHRVKGLRRKNSWSSFRSATVEPEPTASTAPDGGVNLNRALPALPGLDSYKEKKPKPTHIAQLIGGNNRAKSVPNARALQSPATVRPSGMVRNVSNPEDIKRQAGLKRAVEEKMSIGSINESQQLQPHPLVQGNTFYTMDQASRSMVATPTGAPTNMPRPATATAGETKKLGLRKKLSRFWTFSGDKPKMGKMVATN
ncbi:MAG: hypothetical protein L6R38_005609 [Xanthoria sp. 2 TBL-2021]|nr:MAG: hypothetical protein L6R38_005609 [Xanthoria sp. 2 TBL-2021]